MSSRRPAFGVTAIVAAALLWLAAGCFRSRQAGQEASIRDQPLTFVGHNRCAACHAEIAEEHSTTGHAATFTLTRNDKIAQMLCGKSLLSTFPYGPYQYGCDAEGLTVAIPDRFGDRLFPLEYALGSGQHAQTFLTLLPDADGQTVGVEHRMTFYKSDGQFDVTPGQEKLAPTTDGEFFGRVLSAKDTRRCIDCHTTAAEIQGMQLVHLQPGVQCESCHGAGSRHVAAAEQDIVPLARSLMRANWSAEDEIRLCGECHRLPDDIAPERLQRYPLSLVRFQPIGLLRSRCYLESHGQLKCSTCHPPHRPIGSPSAAEQIASCLECHSRADQVHCPVSPATDCIRCHMTSMDVVRGIHFHDHWIRIRGQEPPRDDAGHQVAPVSEHGASLP